MAHHHLRHRSMRLRKHRRRTVTTAPTSSSKARPQQGSASPESSASSNKASAESTLDTTEAQQALEQRHRAEELEQKRRKAELFLNSEIRHATDSHTDIPRIQQSAQVVGPAALGSVTSESGSYLARLSAQAEADQAAAGKKKKHKRTKTDTTGDDSDVEASIYQARGKRAGVVRKVAEKHHRKVEKREKQRRRERMRRIAALDPLKEAEREKGQAKETTFMALIRKYGGIAQEEARRTKNNDGPAVRQGASATPASENDRPTGTDPESETSSMDEHSAYLFDTLDIVDPGVSAAGHLSNIGNSLIFPNIPGLYDRRPVIDLPVQEVDPNATSAEANLQLEDGLRLSMPMGGTAAEEDDLHLDAYVHELLTKKQKFKRAMQGVWAFLKTPVGVIAGIYGFLVVFGGAALVLFLIGAIDGGKNKDFWVEVFSQFENGLFTIPGVGLIPWRLRDTWRMGWIYYYQHLTARLRKRQGLPKLDDKNDIPSVAPVEKNKTRGKKKADPLSQQSDADSSSDESEEESWLPLAPETLLDPHQANWLHRLQTNFAESQSWYRPHETFTHHAFSIRMALWITIFNDLNSLFQCLLCGYMWGYATHYQDRPAWSTGTFMPCSFLAGIAAAVVIWKGGERSKKKAEVEEKLLEAFAKDVDTKVKQMREEAAAGKLVDGVEGAQRQDVGAQVEERADAIGLDTLATEIAQKGP